MKFTMSAKTELLETTFGTVRILKSMNSGKLSRNKHEEVVICVLGADLIHHFKDKIL